MLDELEAIAKAIDVGSVAVILGVLAGLLPQAGALLTVLWLGVRLYNECMIALDRRRAERARRR